MRPAVKKQALEVSLLMDTNLDDVAQKEVSMLTQSQSRSPQQTT